MPSEIQTIQQTIDDSLSAKAHAYWAGASEMLRNEMTILAQREGVAEAVDLITEWVGD